jgi:hypothetical protein
VEKLALLEEQKMVWLIDYLLVHKNKNKNKNKIGLDEVEVSKSVCHLHSSKLH